MRTGDEPLGVEQSDKTAFLARQHLNKRRQILRAHSLATQHRQSFVGRQLCSILRDCMRQRSAKISIERVYETRPTFFHRRQAENKTITVKSVESNLGLSSNTARTYAPCDVAGCGA